jgi:hypothetical protein
MLPVPALSVLPGQPQQGSDDDDDGERDESDRGFFPSGIRHTTPLTQGWLQEPTPPTGAMFQSFRNLCAAGGMDLHRGTGRISCA